MSADEATSSAMPFTVCRMVISQDCTPPPAIEPSRKKPKNNSIVRLVSRSRPDSAGPACAVSSRAWSFRMPLCSMIEIATGTPSSPTMIRPARQPIVIASSAMTGGAAEKPRLPLNVCSANARPMRSLSTEPDRIA